MSSGRTGAVCCVCVCVQIAKMGEENVYANSLEPFAICCRRRKQTAKLQYSAASVIEAAVAVQTCSLFARRVPVSNCKQRGSEPRSKNSDLSIRRRERENARHACLFFLRASSRICAVALLIESKRK